MTSEKVFKGLNTGLGAIFDWSCYFILLIIAFILWDSFTVTKAAAAEQIDMSLKPVPDQVTGKMSLEDLQAINPDAVGWLTIDDTPIDYPVMQGDPEFTYLNHDIYGNTSLTGSLYISVFADRYFNDYYTVVYGHHMSGGLMFGSLDNYKDINYFNNHLEGLLVTENETYDLTVLALARTDAYNEGLYIQNTVEAVKAWESDGSVQTLTGSIDSLEQNDKLLILSTCSSNGTTERTILITRLTLKR